MKNIPSCQIKLGVWGHCKPPQRVQGAKPPEGLKSLQSTLREVVKQSILIGYFFYVLHLKVTEKSLKSRTKSKHFQTNVGRLHSFIKLIKFHQEGSNHFKMIYIVDDHTILFLYLSYISCLNHIAASTSVFCLILTFVGQAFNSKQETLHEHYPGNIISRQNIHTFIILLLFCLHSRFIFDNRLTGEA